MEGGREEEGEGGTEEGRRGGTDTEVSPGAPVPLVGVPEVETGPTRGTEGILRPGITYVHTLTQDGVYGEDRESSDSGLTDSPGLRCTWRG